METKQTQNHYLTTVPSDDKSLFFVFVPVSEEFQIWLFNVVLLKVYFHENYEP